MRTLEEIKFKLISLKGILILTVMVFLMPTFQEFSGKLPRFHKCGAESTHASVPALTQEVPVFVHVVQESDAWKLGGC